MNEENITGETEDMNEENITEETTDMNEELNKTEETECNTDAEEVSEVSAEQAEALEEGGETDEYAEPAVMPLKQTNRFFLAALFPLAFIIILGIVLLVSHFADGKSARSAATGAMADGGGSLIGTEPAYYEIKADEVRGIYIATVHNINFPSSNTLGAAQLKGELDNILLECAEHGFNRIYFQASPMSDALYDSKILPTSSVLTGKEGAPLPEGFDPLAYLCDRAHKAGIEVHAWINPMRVTAGGLDEEELSVNNPAAVEPGYTFTYGGEVYYDLGHPEVRNLQARVCEELVRDYAVDGILFDDYFYPYPVEGEEINDKRTFELYGGDYDNIGDFRRANTTALVSECYDAIKATRPECEFGVAPFGIWQNDDGENGGCPTGGSEGYEMLYCDALAFIKSGKIDYIAPQLYWMTESTVAPYKGLCDWWAGAVKGTDVKLLVSHAAYRVGDWEDSEEFNTQVEYARTKRAYYGSIYYGYESVVNNEYGISDVLAQMYCGKE